MASSDEHLMVAAIDFGNIYSGYAFSFRCDYEKDPLKISTNNLTAGSRGLKVSKTSTCILFEPNGDFHSFGFEAEDKYSDLTLDGEHEGWYYFHRFKMRLYENKHLSRSFKIKDDQGHCMPVIKVFTAVIKYLKDHMLKVLETQLEYFQQSDIQWVLTVPKISSDSSKQLMREAAEEAGIRSDRVIIVLEPEAASLYCKHLQRTENDDTFNTGSKYLVLDAGPTIDITIHQVQKDGSLMDIIEEAIGGNWGGDMVDHAFQHLLIEIIGIHAFHRLLQEDRYSMIEFFREFEAKMHTITPNPSSKVVILNVPVTVNDVCINENDKDIATIVKSRFSFNGNVSIVRNKLKISGERAKEFFSEPVNHIVTHLKKILKEPNAGEVKAILMVGGFSGSLILQNEIKTNFPHLRVIVPPDPGLSVLKGAVLLGYAPRPVNSRFCRYTYGSGQAWTFNPEKYDSAMPFTTSTGKGKVDDLFDIHVVAGECVDFRMPRIVRFYHPSEPDHTAIRFSLYSSIEKNPKYVTDPGCAMIGIFKITMPDTSKGLDRSVMVQMTFGNTELEVDATDKDTMKKVTDFL
ncbi:heat shock 70 kDa protein 12B-like [Ylistrum balloti]|uniref:heat shock 70 kDa protein 12B-like n=1 Tax=Ylistrum balloti TaxID=509963 RepID=UPI002905CB05|nr:heat shock 70 kDa protein 12B-like [Ylistrum balloti]